MSKPGRNPSKRLSDEDRIVWNRFSANINPLPGRKPVAADDTPAPAAPSSAPRRKTPDERTHRPTQAAGPAPVRQHALDHVTRRRIAKGRATIDARIDLHGLVQSEAHAALHRFLHRAHAEGCRLVLVITGKGASLRSDGVLRRAIPGWLATPQFAPLVAGFGAAARVHGGEGALYVRLRNREDRR